MADPDCSACGGNGWIYQYEDGSRTKVACPLCG
jgi:hypothetical protein